MRTLLTLALLCCATMAEAAWRPENQAIMWVGPDCRPCDVAKEDMLTCKGLRVSTDPDAHFVIRKRKPGMPVPTFTFYDAGGYLVDSHVGYKCLDSEGNKLPKEERYAELKRILRKHPKYRPSKPPMAPPVTEVVSREAPVRTAELVTLADDGTVQIPESQGVSPNGRQIQTVQFSPFAADCSGSQAFAMPQTYSMPYSDCSGGGGGGIGGGDFDGFTPPAQSAYMMPQQYAQYGLSYAQPYLQQYAPRQTYTVAYAPRRYSPYASPYAAGGGGINNFSLLSVPVVNPNFSVFGLNGLFGQRAYYSRRRFQYRPIAPNYGSSLVSYGRMPYRTASPFSFASYGRQSYGSRMVCSNGVCYLQ